MSKKVFINKLIVCALFVLSSLPVFSKSELTSVGYARMGVGYTDTNINSELYEGSIQNGLNIIKTANSQYQVTGILGNDLYGVEFALNQRIFHEKGHWDIQMMIDDNYGSGTNWSWADGADKLKMAQAFVGGNGLFDKQLNAYLWAGKKFNGREFIELNDYFWLVNDGNGVGIDNIDLGFGQFNLGFVAGDNGNNGRYALTAQLHQLQLSESNSVRLHANYGFGSADVIEVEGDSGEIEAEEVRDGYQLAAILHSAFEHGWNEVGIRYSEGVRNEILVGNAKDGNVAMLFTQGDVLIGHDWQIAYALTFEQNSLEDVKENWSQIVVRPNYRWNDVMSTSLEVAYDQVDFESKGINSSYKATLTQNFGLGSFLGSRPQIRLIAMYGELDTEYVGDSGAKEGKNGALTLGAMFEAWW